MKKLFVSGTGTDVGKTFSSAFILAAAKHRQLKTLYWKPIQCGAAHWGEDTLHQGDVQMIEEVLLPHQETLNSVYLKEACSPHLALELENQTFDFSVLEKAWDEISAKDYDFILIEGAGGLMVPINENYYLKDLPKLFNWPLAIVAHPALGTLNHTLLSLNCLDKKAQVQGVLFSRSLDVPVWMESDNKKTIQQHSPFELPEIPTLPSWETWKNWSSNDWDSYLSNNPLIDQMIS